MNRSTSCSTCQRPPLGQVTASWAKLPFTWKIRAHAPASARASATRPSATSSPTPSLLLFVVSVKIRNPQSEMSLRLPSAFCLLDFDNSPFAIRNVLLAAFRRLPSASSSPLGAPCPRVPVSPRRRLPSPVSCQRSALRNSPFEIRNRSCQRFPLRRSSFASPAVYGNMRAMCYEAPLLPSGTKACWPGRSCEREGRRLPGLSPWSTRQ